MSVTQIFIIIILQIIIYSLGIYVFFNEKICNIRRGTILFAILSVIYFILKPNNFMLFIYISEITILGVLLKSSIKDKFFTIIKSIFFFTCMEEAIESVISLFQAQIRGFSLSHNNKLIVANIIFFIILCLLSVLKSKDIKLKRNYLNISIMVAMGMMAMSLVLVIASVQYAAPFVHNKRFSSLSEILVIISYISIVILGLFLNYVRSANEQYKHLLETECLLRNSQKENYEILLSKEEETRAFRHDISNHIMLLSEIIVSGNNVKAEKYINDMHTSFLKIQKKNYSTGNEIIDAMLNYHIQQLQDNVKILVTGCCNGEFYISNLDLCSIIANPLQNVVEALNKQEQGEKYLNINMNSSQLNFKLEITNSFNGELVTIIDGIPKTIKHDKRNHGIGLKNVKKLVEKYKGSLNVEILQNKFCFTIILPLKTK